LTTLHVPVLKTIVAGIQTWKISLVREGSDGQLYGHLFVYNQERLINIGENLIDMNYACRQAESEGKLQFSTRYLEAM